MFSLAASIRLATFIITRLHGAEASDVSSQSFHGNIIVIRNLKFLAFNEFLMAEQSAFEWKRRHGARPSRIKKQILSTFILMLYFSFGFPVQIRCTIGDLEKFVYFYGPVGILLGINLLLFASTARQLTCGLWKREEVKSTTERLVEMICSQPVSAQKPNCKRRHPVRNHRNWHHSTRTHK